MKPNIIYKKKTNGYGYTNFFSFLRESFNLWRLLLMISLYHQTKIPISFLCKRGLNPRSLIQLSETLPIKLIGTYMDILT